MSPSVKDSSGRGKVHEVSLGIKNHVSEPKIFQLTDLIYFVGLFTLREVD